MSTIDFHYTGIRSPFRKTSHLKTWMKKIFEQENRLLRQITVVFCTDAYLLQLNQQFLQHDFYTDILTFDISTSHEIHAEIYISLDRTRENARQEQVSFVQETLRVIAHGCLHLCGYGDKTSFEEQQMRNRENYHLNRLGFT